MTTFFLGGFVQSAEKMLDIGYHLQHRLAAALAPVDAP
jgi:hypothetical protein